MKIHIYISRVSIIHKMGANWLSMKTSCALFVKQKKADQS